jgi:hypothetical protein
MHDGAKLLMGLWLAGCAFAFWRSLDAVLEAGVSPFLPLVPLGLLAAGALVLWLGRRATRDDPAWISDVLNRTLKLPH